MSIKNQIQYFTQHYNPNRYWKYYFKLQNSGSKQNLFDFVRLLYLKRSDAFGKSSFGINLRGGAKFGSIPNFPHGLNGILIHEKSKIGKNAIICQQVTIGNSYSDTSRGFPIIEDDVFIGAGAKIIGGLTIGSNVKVGANAVVTKDVPPNHIVVGYNKILEKRKK
ncbi:MAG: serine acetyltransferase [Bacillota bacterium]|nr:serine acetyltransferase [Bacillota bacterium]